MRSRRPRVPEVSAIERATILAGFQGERCPPGGNRFVHWYAEFADAAALDAGQAPRHAAGRLTLSVWRSLSDAERDELRQARRERWADEDEDDAEPWRA